MFRDEKGFCCIMERKNKEAVQYIRRSAGFFIKVVLLVAVLYLLMFVTGTARVSAGIMVQELFTTARGAALLAALVVLAALYPRFGYVRRRVAGIYADADRMGIIEAMHSAGYVLVREDEGRYMAFRAGSGFRRLWLMMDDAVTVRAVDGGVEIDGVRKEVVHALFRLETYIRYRKDGKEN